MGGDMQKMSNKDLVRWVWDDGTALRDFRQIPDCLCAPNPSIPIQADGWLADLSFRFRETVRGPQRSSHWSDHGERTHQMSAVAEPCLSFRVFRHIRDCNSKASLLCRVARNRLELQQSQASV